MTINEYIDKLNNRYKAGICTEHSYRGDLQNLLETFAKDVLITNEPTRISCGAPDYIITKRNIPVGYIEAKDLGADLSSKQYKEQFDRYKNSLNNLIITDYLEFRLFIDGEPKSVIKIGEIQGGKVIPKAENFAVFTDLVKDFCTHVGQTIKSSSKLSKMMAGKARLMANIIEASLISDEICQENSSLKDQMNAFKQILIHDIKPREFADIYAQTIAYGMFAARLHDTSLGSFTRQEAAELIPKSNPFLRKLFQYVAGYDLDTRIVWIVDALAEIFRATNVAELLKDFGKATGQHDPIIHFYETFLSEYDPHLRKSRGVWYTPEPVVNFIVRAVDDILKTEFDLPQGLADTSKTKIKIKDFSKATADLRSKTKIIEREEEVHRVQILDPAAGTGTFLAEVVKQIYKRFEGQEGIWSNYVEQHLLPRLNGFEILMASYAMAHLKLDMLLAETGFKPTKDQRFRIYLTNSLEEHHPDTGTLWANWLSAEANEANRIKRDTPVMVILGNPPYSVSSINKGNWIQNLITDYKKNLNERNIQPLSDDYIKFIRFGQHFIDKNGSGILAYISNNSFLDGIIHRQMRKHLLESFDRIYILDLHGNAKKKEVCCDGSIDENVFDIMAGVSINILIKSNNARNKPQNNNVFYSEIQGKRKIKYDFLNANSLSSINWKGLEFVKPSYYFVDKNFEGINQYEAGFKLNELFKIFSNGFTTERDIVCIHFNSTELNRIIWDLKELNIDDFRKKHSVESDGRDWTLETAKNDVISNKLNFVDVLYRPFDFRKSCYTGKTKGFYAFPRSEVFTNFITGSNLGLIIPKQTKETLGGFLTNKIAGHKSFSSYDKSTVFPLYVYPQVANQQTIYKNTSRIPNLNPKIVNQIADKLNLTFIPEKETPENTFAPIDILDYIYAILHIPTYREKYKEFLKIDFPRIPYPKDKNTFWQLVKLGGELRQIHLLESPGVDKPITKYPVDGDNVVRKIRFETYFYTNEIPAENGETNYPDYLGAVYINDTQCFTDVPTSAWEFYIGGYQPAQKWLKDRKGRELSFEDILHYQKIIVALSETGRIMKEINNIFIE